MRFKENIKQTWLIYVFYLIYIVTTLSSLASKNAPRTQCAFQCILVLLAIHVFLGYTPLRMPPIGYYSLIVLQFLTMYIGRGFSMYSIFSHWDDLVHFLSGIILAILGFIYAVKMFKYKKPLQKDVSPLVIPLFVLLFSVAGAAVWEIFEFCCDTFFGMETQGTTPVDTMTDIIAGTLGAILATIPMLFWSYGKKVKIYELLYNQVCKLKRK